MAVGDYSAEDTEEGTGDHVKGMMSGVHDARDSDQGRAKTGKHDEEQLPDLAFIIHNVQLAADP